MNQRVIIIVIGGHVALALVPRPIRHFHGAAIKIDGKARPTVADHPRIQSQHTIALDKIDPAARAIDMDHEVIIVSRHDMSPCQSPSDCVREAPETDLNIDQKASRMGISKVPLIIRLVPGAARGAPGRKQIVELVVLHCNSLGLSQTCNDGVIHLTPNPRRGRA